MMAAQRAERLVEQEGEDCLAVVDRRGIAMKGRKAQRPDRLALALQPGQQPLHQNFFSRGRVVYTGGVNEDHKQRAIPGGLGDQVGIIDRSQPTVTAGTKTDTAKRKLQMKPTQAA